MAEIAGKPYWELTFDQKGTLTSGTPDAVAEQIAAAGVDNLFVLSHGWGTQRGQAEQLYQQMFPLLSAAADQRPQLGSVGFAGIIWPSIWFPDQPGAPTTATAVGTQSVSAATAGAVNTQAAMTGTQIASALTESFDPDQEAVITEMGRLIDQGQKAVALGAATPQQQEQNVAAFHALLQQITAGAVDAQEDAGETALFDTEDPVSAYQTLAVAMGSATSGGDQQSIGDLFTNVWNGAKDALRVASFWQMKARAGTVGRVGLGPLLELLHNKNPAVRVNLIGHSFGARLVSFALAGISAETKSPVTSLVLIQGAFSHWCFASQQDMPFGQPGALNGYRNRVHGPLVSTFSGYDWAVGTWYPKAAFLAGDFVQAVTVNKWGGMGSDGFQASQPQVDLHIDAAGTSYPMINNAFHRADGNGVITDTSQSAFAGAHSDIIHPEIAWLAGYAAAPDPPPSVA